MDAPYPRTAAPLLAIGPVSTQLVRSAAAGWTRLARRAGR